MHACIYTYKFCDVLSFAYYEIIIYIIQGPPGPAGPDGPQGRTGEKV